MEKFIVESADDWYTDICGAVLRAVYDGLQYSKVVEVIVKEIDND